MKSAELRCDVTSQGEAGNIESSSRWCSGGSMKYKAPESHQCNSLTPLLDVDVADDDDDMTADNGKC